MNGIDIGSPSWRTVRKWAEDRLAKQRLKLESIGISPTESDAARGAIRELKDLLRLPEPQPDLQGQSGNDDL